MICEHCGSYMPDDAITCDHCGSMLRSGAPHETGVRAMRQGRASASAPVIPDAPRGQVPEYGDYDMSPLPLETGASRRRGKPAPALDSFASRPATRRGVPVHTAQGVPPVRAHHGRASTLKMRSTNWMLIGLIVLIVLVGAAAGVYFYMNQTDEGQRAIARRNVLSTSDDMLALAATTDVVLAAEREALLKDLSSANAQAYWLAGEEYEEIGDMDHAITAFRIADIIDPENYDGLLSLASAYELNGQDDLAEAVYLNLEQVINPSRSDAYTALVRMYQEQNRGPEAADMMLLAYENTDRVSFNLQRNEYLPNSPEVDLTAGRYKNEQTIHLTSPQSYDVYYTLEADVELPAGGTLLQGDTVTIPEGTKTLRAVCVSGDLVSDPISVTYTVYYPSPAAPKCNLAPNTYSKAHTVSLRAGDVDPADKKDEKATTQTFYYTIDGSTPVEGESPVYDGNPIALPAGSVTLKAIAVNGYGKTSSTLEVGYKFNIKPALQKIYAEEDVFSGFALFSTTMDEFKSAFGTPNAETQVVYLFQDGDARQLDYGWGHAVFMLLSGKWQLVAVEMNSEISSGPRGVGFGSSESDVIAAYKDMGQKAGPTGNRGLYYSDPNIGRLTRQSDGSTLIQYSCNTLASHVWVLQYWLKGGRVYKISNYYQP
ncbi:MAG: chitobiase/beta-hexosaminidase C-terminal domain-containing protein [Eubacteriales bacterium]|nr:chitobiase/beta-hexosaminidase C-terminal domain-containing protein [Eubacteriales bacterium]